MPISRNESDTSESQDLITFMRYHMIECAWLFCPQWKSGTGTGPLMQGWPPFRDVERWLQTQERHNNEICLLDLEISRKLIADQFRPYRCLAQLFPSKPSIVEGGWRLDRLSLKANMHSAEVYRGRMSRQRSAKDSSSHSP
jgi:hypothetical protein